MVADELERENKPANEAAAVITRDLPRSGPARPSPPAGGVRCRQIGPDDLEAVAELLTKGFPRRDRNYWVAALRYLKERNVPDGYPRYGYMLVAGDRAVGVLLLIFTRGANGSAASVRCNVSSWYVVPELRSLAPLLVLPALRHTDVTFLNTSPEKNTLPIIEAQGFQRFCDGVFASVPVLTTRSWGGKVIRLKDTSRPRDYLPASEVELLKDHEARGCLSMILQSRGEDYPVIFRRRLVRHRFRQGWLPCAQLIYTRDIEGIVRFSGLIGRYLALRGMPLVLLGANQPIAELPGLYFSGRSTMYYRGPIRPRLGDLAYTEDAMFGG